MARGYIQISPLDGLFFGKGRPFSMGDDSWTEAEPLPPPGVVWGALFSQLWYRDKTTPLNVLKTGRTMIMGENLTQLYLPAPLDIFQRDAGTAHHQFYWQEDHKFITGRSGQNVLLKPQTDEQVEVPEGYLLSAGSLSAYAEAVKTFNNVQISPLDEIIGGEFKIGIGRREDLRTAEEGKLYVVNLTQLKPGYSLLTEAEYPDDFPQSGILKIGGEGKMAAFTRINEGDTKGKSLKQSLTLKVASSQSGFFKIYLTTPAPLDSLGLPAFLANKPFRVEGGVTGKPYALGGFDYQARRPKPKSLVAPAGSVYILEYTGDGLVSNEKTRELLGYGHYEKGMNQFEIFPYHG
ncbi:MAG: type III-B CRISPR module-associated Cmr3 family protein [Bacteroidia bacterium]|nr:type III-B CRISPR module-associated Cmr3 family protein [Bacteroidia bacterium]